MTKNRNENRHALLNIADAMVDDILNASDEEIQKEVEEIFGDAKESANHTRDLFMKTSASIAKQRADKIRSEIDKERTNRSMPSNVMSLDEARIKINQLIESAPESYPELTMAARNGEGIPDEDIPGIIEDLIALELISKDDE